jgi:DMSO/TMAO reductase YedYZ molybdopterin-dependent catalytic subunit
MIDRRRFLLLGASGLSAALLDACNSEGPQAAKPLLRFAMRKNEVIERALFRHTHMDAPVDRPLVGSAMPRYYVSRTVPVWNESARGPWFLEIGGLVRRPFRLSLHDLMGLPSVTARQNHYCVEGWTATSEWTGVPVSRLAGIAGVTPDARYVDFQSFDDDYHESWDIESATHPQSIIAYGREGHLLDPAYGAPARLHSPVKLGYKSVKYLTRMVFMPDRNGGYWSDRGYEWYAGT